MSDGSPVLAYSSDPPPEARWRPLYLPAAIVVIAVLVAAAWQTRKPDAQSGDFGAYYRAGRKVLAGRTPYAVDRPYGVLGAYMYGPAFAYWVCGPLARLPYLWAVRLFLLVNAVAAAGCVALCGRAVPAARRFPAMAVATAVTGTYVWANLHNGQVALLLLLACLGGFALSRAGRPLLGGAVLAVAVWLKLYPALLVPYLLLRRDGRGLLGLALGLALLFVAPAPWVGLGSLPGLHRDWIAFCLQTQDSYQTYRDGNSSLLGVLARTPPVSDGTTLYSEANLARLTRAYPAVVAAVTAAVYAGLWVAGRRRPDPWADLAVLLVWMTLASPRAWTFNFAAELAAAAVLLRGRVAPLSAVALAGVVFAITFPTNLLRTPPHWAAWYVLLRDKHFAAAVLLAVAVVVDRGGRPPAGFSFPTDT